MKTKKVERGVTILAGTFQSNIAPAYIAYFKQVAHPRFTLEAIVVEQ
jgi:hypothetical protein